MCSRFHKKPKATQTVKLTLHHRTKALGARYAAFVHRMNQTAHISLQIPAMSKSVEDKSDSVRPSLSARPASISSGYLSASRCRRLRFRVLLARLAPRCRCGVCLSAAGEGVSTVWCWTPQGLFSQKVHFLRAALKILVLQASGAVFGRRRRVRSEEN